MDENISGLTFGAENKIVHESGGIFFNYNTGTEKRKEKFKALTDS